MKKTTMLIFLLSALFFSACATTPQFSTDDKKLVVKDFQKIQVSPDLEIYYFPSQKLPLFSVDIYFSGGAFLDPVGKTGLSLLTMALLPGGTESMSEGVIRELTDEYGASYGFGANQKYSFAKVSGLLREQGKVLDLFFSMLSKPTFPKSVFARVKRNYIDALKKIPDNAEATVDRAQHAYFFNGTENMIPIGGKLHDIQGITEADVARWYPLILASSTIKVLVVGGKEASDIIPAVVERLQKLKQDYKSVHNISASQRKVTSKFVLPPHHVVVIDRPGIKDAQINTGFSGITPLIPEHYEIELSEVILGGPFKSRLNQVLREKQGLVYSISSAGQYSAGYGGFYIKTSTENKKVADVLMELEKQIDLFKRGVGIDEKDLNEAKEYIDGYFDIALSNRYAVAAKFFEVVLDTQQLNYLDRYKENIQAVSLKAFKAALQKYFDYSRFKTVVVGDLKQIEPGLKAKGIKYQVHQVAEFL